MSSAEPAPALPRGAAPALALLGALTALWPLPLRPTHLIAHPLGEGDNHYWMLWRASRRLAGELRPLENVPEGVPIPLMDPINLVLALPTVGWSPALGYNQLLLLNLLLAFGGAWCLARELGASPRGALLAGVAAQHAPFLGGVVSFGITESLPVGWLGLHAAALLAWARTGRWAWVPGAGLALGAFALAGWYHALFGLVVEAGLLLWIAARRPAAPGRVALGILAQGLLAALLVLPALFAFLEVRELWAERWHGPSPLPAATRPMWRHTPSFGTDLLNYLLPTLERVPVSKSVYLGGVTLGLALLGGRRALPLLLLAAPLWGLGLGYWLSVGGSTQVLGRAWRLPAAWLVDAAPALQGLSHWHRAAGPASLLLAVAAGLGAERLLRRRPALWVPLALALVADSLLLSQTPWPRDTTDPTPPAALRQLRVYAGPQGGALVLLPFDNGRREFTDEVPRLFNRWQPEVGLPFAESYEGPDALLRRNRLIAVADRQCGVAPTTPAAWRPPAQLQKLGALREPGVLEQAVAALREDGVAYVALVRARARDPRAPAALLREALGEPLLDVDGIVVWEVPAVGDSIPSR